MFYFLFIKKNVELSKKMKSQKQFVDKDLFI